MIKGFRRAAALAAVSVSSAAFATPAHAATFNVACGDVAGLRTAVTNANATAAADVIEIADVDSCVFTFVNSVNGGSPDQTGLAPVTQPLTINGHGARFVRAGAANLRFIKNQSSLTVNEVTFDGGRLVGAGTQGVFGAGIYNVAGALTLNGASFESNAVSGSTNSRGGAIFTLGGTVAIDGGSFSQNTAATHGGAVATFTNIFVIPAVPAVVEVTGTTFSQNSAATGGAFAGDGGAIRLHDVTAQNNSTPTASFFVNTGGALYSTGTNVTVDAGSDISSNTAAAGGAIYALGASVDVADSQVNSNTGTVVGGGIVTGNSAVTIEGSTLAENTSTVVSASSLGGALFVNGGTVEVQDSTLRANTVEFAGGGFYIQNATGTISRSTIRDNDAEFTNGAGFVAGGHITVDSSTVSANTATTFANGGLAVTPSAPQNNNTVPGQQGRLDVVSTTLADNGKTGTGAPGNQLAVNGRNSAGQNLGAQLHVTDSIVGATDADAPQAPACATSNGGVLADDGGNLEYPANTCGFDTVGDPKLAALAGNGGDTLTHLPGPGSAAIDIGGADCPATDQRGATRPDGEACDAGSVETPAPQTTIGDVTSPTNDPSIPFSSDTDGATFECRVDGGAWEACASPYEPTLADGSRTVEVRAIDSAGYPDRSPASVTFTVDTAGPVVDITSVSQEPGLPATAMATFTVDGTAEDVECKVDDGAFEDCTSPYTTGPLTAGQHTLTVRATDELGNVGSDSQAFTIDTAPPETTITGGTSGTVYSPSASFTFTSSKPSSTFECKLDGGAFTPCTSPKGYGDVAPGTHTFSVRAIDANGVADPTPATRTWTYKKCVVRVGLLPNVTICV